MAAFIKHGTATALIARHLVTLVTVHPGSLRTGIQYDFMAIQVLWPQDKGHWFDIDLGLGAPDVNTTGFQPAQTRDMGFRMDSTSELRILPWMLNPLEKSVAGQPGAKAWSSLATSRTEASETSATPYCTVFAMPYRLETRVSC